MAAYRKKSSDDPRKESITEDPEDKSITKDSKRTLSLRTQWGSYYWKTYREPYHWGPSRASGPWMTFAPKKIIFGILVTLHDRVGDVDKFLHENFGLGSRRFH